MTQHDFGEKAEEYNSKTGKNVPVWQSPKYKMARDKAIEMIDSGKYNLSDCDFWILMNLTKSVKMMYSGLIISHNGCLKINDNLNEDMKFKPGCVTLDKDGYKNSLVYTYLSPEQHIFEVGEVSQSNCKNEYPYAMAFKRLFDRVVLKLSKLAYSGVYSDSESDEFKQQLDIPAEKPPQTINIAAVNTLKAKLEEYNTVCGRNATEQEISKFYKCSNFNEFDYTNFKKCITMLDGSIKKVGKVGADKK